MKTDTDSSFLVRRGAVLVIDGTVGGCRFPVVVCENSAIISASLSSEEKKSLSSQTSLLGMVCKNSCTRDERNPLKSTVGLVSKNLGWVYVKGAGTFCVFFQKNIVGR